MKRKTIENIERKCAHHTAQFKATPFNIYYTY